MAKETALRIGTRGSRLALWQANAVRDALIAAHALPPDSVEIVVIKTSGDAIKDRPLSEAGGKGLFTKEIEAALLAGDVSVAVHSAKDMETFLPDGLTVGAVLPREDVRDALIAREATFARRVAARRAASAPPRSAAPRFFAARGRTLRRRSFAATCRRGCGAWKRATSTRRCLPQPG